MNETFGREEIAGRLHTKYIGRKIYFYDSIDSTNVRGRMLAEGTDGRGVTGLSEGGAEHGTLVVADRQTAGRGRCGREWDSPAGKNIYFTLILKPDFAPDKASMLTLVMAMAVAKGMRKTVRYGSELKTMAEGEVNIGKEQDVVCGIKWPNDLVINGRKVCGILTEMSVEQGRIAHVLVGVGINVGKQEFAPELVDKATDLETECGQKISRSELLAGILEAFEEEYELFLKTCDLSGLKDRYNACLVNCGREVRVLDPKGEFGGIAGGINVTGELLVELPDGSITEVYAGEVSVRGIYGYV